MTLGEISLYHFYCPCEKFEVGYSGCGLGKCWMTNCDLVARIRVSPRTPARWRSRCLLGRIVPPRDGRNRRPQGPSQRWGRRRTAGRIWSEETRTTQARSQLLSHRKTVAGKCENHKKLSQRKLSGWELESAWNVGLRCDCARSKWTAWQLLWMPPLQVIWC